VFIQPHEYSYLINGGCNNSGYFPTMGGGYLSCVQIICLHSRFIPRNTNRLYQSGVLSWISPRAVPGMGCSLITVLADAFAFTAPVGWLLLPDRCTTLEPVHTLGD
jgi:hypothetical protein